MQKQVVYVLGAGFSAPRGLPVMSNFLVKSKDMYALDSSRYAYFQEVFAAINDMSVVKNYFQTNLFNIEEILSILEMRAYVEGSSLKEAFTKYICDVIQYYTPAIARIPNRPSNWHRTAFGSQDASAFGYFVTNLLGVYLSADSNAPNGLRVERLPQPQVQYSVITLNYDMILESFAEFLEGSKVVGEPICFRKYVLDEN